MRLAALSLVALACSLLAQKGWAQETWTPQLWTQAPIYETSASAHRLETDTTLAVCADANFFFLNNEYFTPYVEGYTLVGYQLRPLVKVGIGGRVTLAGGLQALRYGGMDSFHKIYPFFAASLNFAEGVRLVVGNLPGLASHRLHPAVLNQEDQLTERPELGFQLFLRKGLFEGNAWINWRQFIFLGDTIPEKFTAGVSTNFKLADNEAVAVDLPLSLVFDHVGGQISNFPDTMQSYANLTVSPCVAVRNTGGRFVRSVTLQAHLFGFHTMVGSAVHPFGNGIAVSPEVKLSARHLLADISWYRARDFWAPHGTYLYSSLSNYKGGVYSPHRSLLNFGAAFDYSLTGQDRFLLEFRGYYDTFEARFDYSYSLSVTLCLDRALPASRHYSNK